MIRHSCSDTPGLFRLFVYGTLKRGYWNHEAYCGSAVSIEEAAVRGRLYKLPSEIPVLVVPDYEIIACGSADIPDDMALQHRLEANTPRYSQCSPDGWQQIGGELITLPNPTITVPPIDRLEGFHPGGASLYRRVLVPVKLSDECDTVAWCYVASCGLLRDAKPTGRASWP